jgi:hypothetical protein
MNSNFDQFDSLRNKLNFGEVINESWNLFVKVLGIGVLAVVIHGISSFVVSQVIGRLTGLNYAQDELKESLNNVSDFDVIALELQSFYLENLNTLISTSLLSSLIMILAFPLAGGFMLVCREADENGAANIGTLFQGFKSQYWGRLMVLGLVYLIISKIALALFIIPGIYIWVAAVIACPFVMFTNASGIQSLQNSIKLVNQSWFTVFQILLVASLIGFAGYLLCFVGRVVSYPFVLVTVYMLYKHMVGFDSKDVSKIGE